MVRLPKGDLLIHAGDVSFRGERYEVEDFLSWFAAQPFTHKVFIAGNHDFFFEKSKPRQVENIVPPGIHYLNDSGVSINGCNIWGSPITPKFFHWAFNRRRGAEIKKHWDLIPDNTHLLITHGPPYRILDLTNEEQHVGCKELLERIRVIRPQYHLFGHIHEAYGKTKLADTVFINASQVNEHYELIHKPFLLDWKAPVPSTVPER